MKATNWDHSNCKIAENQDEYKTLHGLKLPGTEGYTITRWKLTFLERLRVLWTGIVWRNDMTFNRPFTPTFMSVHRKECYLIPTDKELKEETKD